MAMELIKCCNQRLEKRLGDLTPGVELLKKRKKPLSSATEEWERGPGLLLEAGQTPGKGASLTSIMCLLLVIKTQIIGAMVIEELRSNERTS